MTELSPRFGLKRLTSDAHAALEAVIGPVASLASYGRYLQGLHAFRGPIEASLMMREWPEEFEGWRPLAIRQFLAEDLVDLGYATGPPRSTWAAPDDVSGLFGILYVLEGSALGARVLYQSAQTLGLNGAFGARHLAAQTASPDQWKQFVALLEKASGFDLGRAAVAANRGFSEAMQAVMTFDHVPE